MQHQQNLLNKEWTLEQLIFFHIMLLIANQPRIIIYMQHHNRQTQLLQILLDVLIRPNSYALKLFHNKEMVQEYFGDDERRISHHQ
jgi:hypothetical protein